jgi:hypothetical protein
MTGPPLTARVDGLIPWGHRRPVPVDLAPGEVWSVGRRDERFLAVEPQRAARHLAVPDAGPDLSVHQLELRVGTVGVAVASSRGAGVSVDGAVRPGPVVLGHGTSYIGPSVSGVHVDFAVTILSGDRFGAGSVLVASGTTLTVRLDLEPGSALWRVAHALAWPCTSAARRPHAPGWSGRDVADRATQLGWAATGPRATTVLAQQLHTLADKVANCRLSDGRRADLVLPSWPPWDGGDPGETRDQRAERRNRCVAEALWRAGAVESAVIDARR